MKVFLDSGAYSAFTKGAVIDIDKYIAFIKKHSDIITAYSNLDVIRDSKATWQNQIIMEKAGLNPLPVFHFGEDIKWLKRYLNKGKYDYMALGGMIGHKSPLLDRWLNDLFTNYFTDDMKIHGFGVNGYSRPRMKILLKYPWYSIDSTDWKRKAIMGKVFIARSKDGKYQYQRVPLSIIVSSKTKTKTRNEHISNISPMRKQLVLSYIKHMRYKLKDLDEDQRQRSNMNADYMAQLEKYLHTRDNKYKTTIYLVGNEDGDTNNNILVSFYYLSDNKIEALRQKIKDS